MLNSPHFSRNKNHYDVTIVGAGVIGLGCAWRLICSGARVRVIERQYIGAGASGGFVGALAPHVPENWNPKKEFQLESLLMAAHFWGDVESASAMASGYARVGRLQPILGDVERRRALERGENAKKLWRGLAKWQVCQLQDQGWAINSPSGFLINDDLSARIYPLMAIRALARAIQLCGGVIVKGEPDEFIAKGDVVLWANGYSGLREISADLGLVVGWGVKGQALLARFDERVEADLKISQLPQVYGENLYIVPHVDGSIAVGSTSENQWDHPDKTDKKLDALWGAACDLCPVLQEARIIKRWAGIRARAKSRAPMLGVWPGRENHFVANGGFKIGFGMTPKIAEVMKLLILHQRDQIPEGFRVSDCF